MSDKKNNQESMENKPENEPSLITRHSALVTASDELSLVTDHSSLVTVFEVTDVIDLHTFAPRDIPAVVETYLEEARAKGFPTVRLIHGRGKGVQRARVQSVLRRTPFVASFQDAPMEAGGWGATIVWFAPEK